MPTHYRGSKDEVRALNALIVLMRASDAVSARLQSGLSARGLTASQFGIVEALYHLGPLCQSELAAKQLRSCASMTSVVEGLERRGLVARKRNGEDKRFVRVALTAKGRRLMADVFPGHARLVAKVLAALEPAEQQELRRLGRKLGLSAAGPGS